MGSGLSFVKTMSSFCPRPIVFSIVLSSCAIVLSLHQGFAPRDRPCRATRSDNQPAHVSPARGVEGSWRTGILWAWGYYGIRESVSSLSACVVQEFGLCEMGFT